MSKNLFVCIASVALLASCNQSPEDQRVKAEQAQQEANEKIGQANTEAQQKAQAAQKDADEKIAKANVRAQEEASKTQLAANQEIRTTNDEILKTRNDYQVETSKSVTHIDNKLDGLKVKSQSAKSQKKADFDNAMPKVVSQRAVVKEDFANLPSQNSQTFAGFKAKTDQDITDLRKMVDELAMNL